MTYLIQGFHHKLGTVYYTGPYGSRFISSDQNAAQIYSYPEGAQRKATKLNEGAARHGCWFEVLRLPGARPVRR